MPSTKALTKFQKWLLGAGDLQGSAASTSAPADARTHTLDREAENRDLEARLCKILQEQPAVTAGRIFFIDLDLLKRELAGQWPKLDEVVDSVARRAFRRNLSPQDAYCRHGDRGFLVVFGTLSTSSAAVVCQRIANDLRVMLMGRAAGPTVTVKTVVGHADSQLLMQEVSLIDQATRIGAQAASGSSGGLPANPRMAAATQTDPDRFPHAPGAHASDDPGWDQLHWKGGAIPDLRDALSVIGDIKQPTGPEIPANEPGWVQMVGETAIPPENSPAALAPKEDLEVGPAYLFQPVWDTKTSLLSTYLCLTPEEVMSEPTCTAAGADLDEVDGDAVAAFDLSRLLNAADILDELVRNYFQLFVNTAVHAETMGSRRYRRQYLHILRRIPENLQKFLIVQLYGLPAGVPTVRVAECVTALRPYCGAVLVETGLNPGELEKYAGIGVHSVGLDLRTVSSSANRLISQLSAFAAEAQRHKMWSFLTGVTTSNQAAVALTAGVRYLSGQRVGPASEVPMHIRKFTLKDFYRDTNTESFHLYSGKRTVSVR